ncbi:hypothetical protein AB1Y20_014551 [Prymnesium parvum]|uniref:PH domain-containing protein n=1 Tax=Prymnesium parvum TaxID=97485 RepID=A0AB34IDL1_PRYPA
MEGFLLKLRKKGLTSWQRRYFVLDGDVVYYYQDRPRANKGPGEDAERGSIKMRGALVDITSSKHFGILDSSGRRWQLQAKTAAECDEWVHALTAAAGAPCEVAAALPPEQQREKLKLPLIRAHEPSSEARASSTPSLSASTPALSASTPALSTTAPSLSATTPSLSTTAPSLSVELSPRGACSEEVSGYLARAAGLNKAQLKLRKERWFEISGAVLKQMEGPPSAPSGAPRSRRLSASFVPGVRRRSSSKPIEEIPLQGLLVQELVNDDSKVGIVLLGDDRPGGRTRKSPLVLFAEHRTAAEVWLRALQRASGGLVLSEDDESRVSERSADPSTPRESVSSRQTGASGVLAVLGTLDSGGVKSSGVVRSWQLRWVTLSEAALQLYERRHDDAPASLCYLSDFKHVSPVPQMGEACFEVGIGGALFTFKAASADQMSLWIAAVLEATLLASALDVEPAAPPPIPKLMKRRSSVRSSLITAAPNTSSDAERTSASERTLAQPTVPLLRRLLCPCWVAKPPRGAEMPRPSEKQVQVTPAQPPVKLEGHTDLPVSTVVEVAIYQITKKKGQLKWKCDLHLRGTSLKLKASNAWAAYSLKVKIDQKHEPLLRAYAASLSEIYQCHERRLQRRGQGAFAISSEQFLMLVHYLPMIPSTAKYLNLGQFLAKPAAKDFIFLQPLLNCRQPTAAKAAFFSALPNIKNTLSSITSPTPLSSSSALKIVDSVADAMDKAASAGGGV